MATFTLTSDGVAYPTLQDALSHATNRDFVTIAISDDEVLTGYVNVYTTYYNYVSGGLLGWDITGGTIAGNTSDGNGLINGKRSTTVTNVTMDRNYGATGGAVMLSGTAPLNVSHSTFTGNTANSGGAIGAPYGQTVSVFDSTFSQNVALSGSNGGGAIYTCRGLTIGRTAFSDNRVTTNGGAIYVERDGGYATSVFDSMFTDNTAAGYGGAVYLSGASSAVEFSGTTFSGNSANKGGAFYTKCSVALQPQTGGTRTVFADNRSRDDGGAIYVESGTVEITDVVLASNYAAGAGGAIFVVSSGTADISGATFAGNTTAAHGGAVYAADGITVTDSLFLNNQAPNSNRDAGALYLAAGTSTVSGSTFTGNIAGNFAGAIYFTGSGATVSRSVFDRNAGLYGGAIAISADSFVAHIVGSTFAGNAATGHSGAIFVNVGTADISGSTFGGNFVSGNGGALTTGARYNSNTGFFTITANGADRTVFDGNTSTASGGAIYQAYNGGTNSISGADFTSNSAATGGAIYLLNGALSISDAAFCSNTADNGGAIWSKQNIEIDNSTFSGNAAAARGAALYLYENTAAITDSIFSGNSAATGGGAIYVNGGRITLSDSVVFADNRSGDDGGAVFVNSSGTAEITDVVLSRNYSAGAGGAVFVNSSGTAEITGATLTGNTSNANGGAIYAASGVTVTDSLFLNNQSPNSTRDAGALYLSAGDSTVSGTTFTGNIAGSYAGALYLGGSGATVSRSVFDRNISTSGGAIAISANSLVAHIVGSTFAGNISTEHSGAVFINVGTADISGSTLGGNFASGDGGALTTGSRSISNAGYFTITANGADRTVFDGNTSTATGGAIYQGYTGGTNSICGADFIGNNAVSGGAISLRNGALSISNASFRDNTATNGGAIYSRMDLTISNSVFSENSANYGAALYLYGGTAEITDCVIFGNTARNGAVFQSAATGKAYISGTTFTGNTGNAVFNHTGYLSVSGSLFLGGEDSGDAIDNRGTAGITGSTFATAKDTVANTGTLTFTGTNHLNASVTGTGTFNVTDGTLIFGNAAAIDVAGLTLSGNNAVTFGGTGTVNFTSQSLANVSITVSSAVLPAEGESFTIATGIASLTDAVITIDGTTPVNLNGTTEFGGGTYTFTYEDSSLAVSQQFNTYDTVYAVLNGATEVVIDGETVSLTGNNAYDSVATAKSHLNPGGQLVIVGAEIVSGVDGTRTMLVDGTFNGNVYLTNGATFSDRTDLNVKMERVTMPTAGKNMYVIYTNNIPGGNVDLTITDSDFVGDISLTSANTGVTLCNDVTYVITDTHVAGGVYGGGSDANPIIAGDVNITLTGSTAGKIIGDRANRMEATQSITVTLAGSTVGSVAKFDYGEDYQYVLAA
ncbi:MAG: hypothetical protein MR051_04150 [Lentisphaeria bacterium]|nr:hypothetical protein [Lentisphaeria bacterium]